MTETTTGFSGVTSATGLQLLIEQNDARLNVAYDSLKRALKGVGRQILRLYRQFATDIRLLRYAGDNGELKVFYFKGSDISSDDVVLDADADSNMSPAQRREAVLELLDRGLFTGEDGKLSVSAKNRVLELLGYPSLAGSRDLGELNRARAGAENLKMRNGSCDIKEYDDHETHVYEHTAYLLSEQLEKTVEERILSHLAEHKKRLKGGNYGDHGDEQ